MRLTYLVCSGTSLAPHKCLVIQDIHLCPVIYTNNIIIMKMLIISSV